LFNAIVYTVTHQSTLLCYALASIICVAVVVTSFFGYFWPLVYIYWPALGPEFETKTYGKLQEAPRVHRVLYRDVLLLNRLDAFPSAAQSLLPQADPVVSGADCEGIAAQAPAHAPRGGIDIKLGALPLA
jgi:hypothetical protein